MWFSFLTWSILVIYALLIITTTTVVLLENRQPAKTVAWIIVLVLLPVVGLIIFYFFGQNIRKERYIGRRSYERLTREMLKEANYCPPSLYQPKYERLIRFNERKNKAVLTAGNEVHLLTSGREWVLSLLHEFARARHHIHLQTYIIEDDAVGRLIADALTDCARRGVEVRLLYDDVGCWNVPRRFFDRLAAEGIHVRPFLPVRFPSLTHRANYRNHRKLCVIDGTTGYVGGMNLAMRYMNEGNIPWRDMHLCIRGEAVGGLQRIFTADWCFTCNELLSEACYFPTSPHSEVCRRGALIQIIAATPVAHYPEIMYGLTWIIQNCSRYLYIQTPYFMPSDTVLQALQTAALSGVDVRIMIPEKPDSRLLRWGNDSYFEDALRAGIRLYVFRGGFLHAKCAVADDDWCTVGSTNMDSRSFDNNFEANAFIYDRAVAESVRDGFLRDMEHCRAVDLAQWRKRPIYKKYLESITRIFSPIL